MRAGDIQGRRCNRRLTLTGNYKDCVESCLPIHPDEVCLDAALVEHILHPQTVRSRCKSKRSRRNPELAEDPGNVDCLATHPPGRVRRADRAVELKPRDLESMIDSGIRC